MNIEETNNSKPTFDDFTQSDMVLDAATFKQSDWCLILS